MVGAFRKTRGKTRFHECRLRREPLVSRPPFDRDGTVLAVVLATKVEVILQSTIKRQDFRKAPQIVALGRPSIEVFRDGAEKDRAVDRARAAGHFSAWYEHWLGLRRG